MKDLEIIEIDKHSNHCKIAFEYDNVDNQATLEIYYDFEEKEDSWGYCYDWILNNIKIVDISFDNEPCNFSVFAHKLTPAYEKNIEEIIKREYL